MDKIKLAKTISTIANPPIISIPLFVLVCIVLSFENGVFNFDKFIILEIITLVFTSIMPFIIILSWAKKLNTDSDISNREDRFIPLVIGIVSYFIGFLISFALSIDNFLTLMLLCYSVNTGIVLLITKKWKISVHTTGLSGPVSALILLMGPLGAVFGIIYPILVWSRVILKKHTIAQAISGGVQGFFLAVFELYLFMYLLNLPVYNIIGLYDSILYILAIITTPIILGILSYSNLKNTRLIFIFCEIIVSILFLIFTPVNVFIIFVILTLTSILVSYFAGANFKWYDVIF